MGYSGPTGPMPVLACLPEDSDVEPVAAGDEVDVEIED